MFKNALLSSNPELRRNLENEGEEILYLIFCNKLCGSHGV
jgi:hypothetical protein